MSFPDFKTLLATALADYFGKDGMSRGDKAICINANTYRIDADVVPTFEYRWYKDQFNSDGSHYFYSGVSFYTDKRNLIFNWPDRNYANGVQRNSETVTLDDATKP